MFWLKGCFRCKGDLYEGADIHGPYVACLQCGRNLTAEQEQSLWRPALALAVLGSASALHAGPATEAIAGSPDAIRSAA